MKVRFGLACLAIVCGCGRVGFAWIDAADGNALDAMIDAPADPSFASTAFAYWKFDERSGFTALDASGNGHTLTLFNGTAWGTGMFDGVVTSDGTDDYLSTPQLDLSATAAVTVSVWANRPYSAGPKHTLFELTTNTNSFTTGFGLFPDDTGSCGSAGGILVFLVGNAGYNMRCYTQPSSGVWHHLVAIYDKSQPTAGEIALFIDGVPQGPISMPNTADNTNTFGNAPFFLFTRGGTIEFNAGSIDEMTIFDRALTAAEISML